MDLGHQRVTHCPSSNAVLASSTVPTDGNPYPRIKGSCPVVLVIHRAILDALGLPGHIRWTICDRGSQRNLEG
jgi:hypothetical protein